ncbi:MAG: hypothetical protein HS117_15745 [Verrucomicrobiaceae bacterium]|jgi:hypothetical protein|nr:hypothetical protein [Verrucomicrobiaceae bacterium]
MRHVLFLVLAAALAPGGMRGAELAYHGFTVNTDAIEGTANRDSVIAAVKRQIDIVETVGLADEIVAFFRTVPVRMLADTDGTPGVYSARMNRVALKGVELAATKPILLHELLHAYHDQKMPDGGNNAQVKKFYELALTRYRMKKSEYFLTNEKEFFAVTASIFLFGPIKRAPFDRATIQSTQPNYWLYLEGLFGKRAAAP